MNKYRLTYNRHDAITNTPLFALEKKGRWFGWSPVSEEALTEKEGREFIETLLRVERENDPNNCPPFTPGT